MDLVVESFDEAERNFVLGSTVGGDAVPVPLNQFGKFLERLEPLPAQLFTPLVEEASRPAFAPVVPQLTEAFLEKVSGVEPLVGG